MEVKTQPTLHTPRLRLRPFHLLDAGRVQLLAGERDVAATTREIPHPYEDGMAETWIVMHSQLFDSNRATIFAIVPHDVGECVGAISLVLDLPNDAAELGYWIGKEYWGCGYATEAATAIVRFGFERYSLVRVFSHCMTKNPASGRVLMKAGMRHEGRVRRFIKKWGVHEDVDLYSILREEWEAQRSE